jgi:integrase/recombinase XerC
MNSELVLHSKSRWSNQQGRKVIAVKAIQNQDEAVLMSLLEAYLRVKSLKKNAISPKTVLRYKQALKIFLEFVWHPNQNINILQVDEDALDQFMQWLSTPDPAKKTRSIKANLDRQYYSRSAIDLVVVSIKTFFKALEWTDAMTQNPTLDLRSPNIPREEHQPVLYSDQIQELKNLAPNHDPVLAARDAAILELGLSTMLRANEIVALDLQDVDLNNKMIKVLGKGSKTRFLPLTASPLLCLKTWLMVRSSLVTNDSTSALFLSASRRNKGSRIAYPGVYAVIRAAFVQLEMRQPGLKLGGMHTLRRSGATRFHRKNKDIAVLAGQLGHASFNTTQRYVKLDLSALRDALEAVEEDG